MNHSKSLLLSQDTFIFVFIHTSLTVVLSKFPKAIKCSKINLE